MEEHIDRLGFALAIEDINQIIPIEPMYDEKPVANQARRMRPANFTRDQASRLVAVGICPGLCQRPGIGPIEVVFSRIWRIKLLAIESARAGRSLAANRVDSLDVANIRKNATGRISRSLEQKPRDRVRISRINPINPSRFDVAAAQALPGWTGEMTPDNVPIRIEQRRIRDGTTPGIQSRTPMIDLETNCIDVDMNFIGAPRNFNDCGNLRGTLIISLRETGAGFCQEQQGRGCGYHCAG